MGTKEQTKLPRNLVVGVTLVLVSLSAGMGYLFGYRNASLAHRPRLRELNNFKLMKIIRDIEAAKESLGRLPADETELVETIGRKLPDVYVGDFGIDLYPTPLMYTPSQGGYRLSYMTFSYDWVYDSKTPERGWFKQHW